MADCIDRQVAIELIHNLYPSEPIMRRNRERWKERYRQYIEVEEALERLPSAQPEPSEVARDIATIIENEKDMRVILQPERKKGKWLVDEDGNMECPFCGNTCGFGNYCNECGADMRGESDETD